MGVQGLWQLISSTGKPVPLESLEGKVLAVDVSVWLHQLSKGMRDGAGNPLPNAHLHGLFTRICKLIHCRIKPVFVFDGGVPALKKQTLANRKSRRDDAEKSSEVMQQKILTNFIRSQVLQAAAGDAAGPIGPYYNKPKSKTDKDTLFQLPPMSETSKKYLRENSHQEDAFIERRELQAMIEEEYEDVNQIDVDSEEFKSLPSELQHEIIYDIQQNRKNYNMSKIAELPSDSNDFSSYQLSKVLKHSKLHSRLEEVRKEMNNRQTQDLSKHYNLDIKGANAQSHRLVSDERSHVLLIKGLKNKSNVSEVSEKKKKLEMEKREKNMKLLEKVFPELSECAGNNIQPPDEEIGDVKRIDIMKLDHKDVDEEGISNDIDSVRGDKNAYDIGESSSHLRFDCKASDYTTRKKAYDKPPRYRPVIEVETDSSDENVDDEAVKLASNQEVDWYEKSMFTDRVVNGDTIVIDDDEIDSEDEQMQLAIALSLQPTAGDADDNSDDNHEHPDLTASYVNVKPPTRDNSYNTVVEENVSQGTIDSKLSIQSEEISFKQGKDKTRETEKDKNLPLNKGQSITKPIKQGRKLVNEAVSLKSTGESIFKRQISNSSSDTIKEDNDDEPVRRKIIRTESEESNGVRDEDECNREVNTNPSDVSEDSEDDFIEVKIDPNKVQEDELFPSSMFALDLDKSEIEKTRTLEGDNNSTERRGNDEKSDTESVDQRVDICASPSSDISNDKIRNSRDKDKTIETEDIEEIDEPNHNEKVEGSLIDEEKENGLHGLNMMTDEIQETAKAISDEMVETVVDEGEVDDVLESDISRESEIVESVMERPESPKVPDLVKTFQAMDERNIRGLRDGLAKESRQLQQERGRQERLAMSITDQMHTEAQELLKLFGIPYIVSPTEAEAQCAQLDFSKQTQGTITDDSDIWLFGGKCVYKNFFNQQKHVECFRLDSIQNKLGLTRQALINIALLCGSDYTHGIQGVGPVTAMEILAEFPGEGIEALTKFRSWWDMAQKDIEFRTQNKLRAKLRELELTEGFPQPQVVDAYLNPVVDNSSEKLTWGTPDLDQLRHFAMEKLGWTKEKVDETLQPVLKRINDKQNQMRISAYFQPEIYMQPAKMKSKRLQNVVTKFLNPDAATEANTAENVDKTIAKAKSEKQKRRKRTTKSDNIAEENDNNPKEINEDIKDSDNFDTIETGSKFQKSNIVGISKSKKGCQRKSNISKDSLDTKSTEKRKLRSKALSVQYVEDSETSASTESDSSSDSEEEDYSSDGGVVETSLDVSEILGMNIGPNLQQCAEKDKEGAEGEKVFVSGLNLDEILNLKSDDTMDENMLERWDSGIQSNDIESVTTVEDNNHRSQEAVAQVCPDKDDSDYTNEGGFCKDNSDDDHMEADEAKIKGGLQTRINTRRVSGKRNISEVTDEPQEEKRQKRQTRSSNILSDNSSAGNTVNKIQTHNRKVINSQVSDVGKLNAQENKNTSHNKTETFDKTQSLGTVKSEKEDDIIVNTAIEDCDDFNERRGKNIDVKKEVPVYASNPLKRLATGVPWEHRSTKRGRLPKGSGKGKSLHVEPKEKLLRKKETGKHTRKAIGVVNLSESSSDSD